MLCHVVLGFLRDGKARHGYELLIEYRTRLGDKLNAGNLYRELGRLAESGLVRTDVNPPGADARRIPYQITDRGRHLFDQWVAAPSSDDADFPTWLLFLDRLPAEDRERILDRRQERLWMQSKELTREREDALVARQDAATPTAYDPLPALLERRIKLVTAELEFLKQFRVDQQRCRAGGSEHARARKPMATESRALRRERKPR